jgi:metal-responsive CopG/Arc/MetJ family transcriptional regulator
MKTAVSVPDEVFKNAEDFARRKRLTRSALFTTALREYLEHHRREDITVRLDQVYGTQDSSLEPAIRKLQQASLPKETW